MPVSQRLSEKCLLAKCLSIKWLQAKRILFKCILAQWLSHDCQPNDIQRNSCCVRQTPVSRMPADQMFFGLNTFNQRFTIFLTRRCSTARSILPWRRRSCRAFCRRRRPPSSPARWTSRSGGNLIKLFSSSPRKSHNKLKRLPLARLSILVYCLW